MIKRKIKRLTKKNRKNQIGGAPKCRFLLDISEKGSEEKFINLIEGYERDLEKNFSEKYGKDFNIIGDLFPSIEDDYIPSDLNWFTNGFLWKLEYTKLTKAIQIFKKIESLKKFYDKEWIDREKTVHEYIKGGDDKYDNEIKKLYKNGNYVVTQCSTFKPIIYKKFKEIKDAAIEESFKRYNNAKHWREIINEKLYESKIDVEYDDIFNACSEKNLDEGDKDIVKNFDNWLKQTSLSTGKFYSTDSIGTWNRAKNVGKYIGSFFGNRYDESESQHNMNGLKKKLQNNIKKFVRRCLLIVKDIIETEKKISSYYNNNFIKEIRDEIPLEKWNTVDSDILDIKKIDEYSNFLRKHKITEKEKLNKKNNEIQKLKTDRIVPINDSINRKIEEINRIKTTKKNIEKEKNNNLEEIKKKQQIIENNEKKNENEDIQSHIRKLKEKNKSLVEKISDYSKTLKTLEGNGEKQLGSLKMKQKEAESENTKLNKEKISIDKNLKIIDELNKLLEDLKTKIEQIKMKINNDNADIIDINKDYITLSETYTDTDTKFKEEILILEDKLKNNNNILIKVNEELEKDITGDKRNLLEKRKEITEKDNEEIIKKKNNIRENKEEINRAGDFGSQAIKDILDGYKKMKNLSKFLTDKYIKKFTSTTFDNKLFNLINEELNSQAGGGIIFPSKLERRFKEEFELFLKILKLKEKEIEIFLINCDDNQLKHIGTITDKKSLKFHDLIDKQEFENLLKGSNIPPPDFKLERDSRLSFGFGNISNMGLSDEILYSVKNNMKNKFEDILSNVGTGGPYNSYFPLWYDYNNITMDPLLYHKYSNNKQHDKNEDDFRDRINKIRDLKKNILEFFIKEYSIYFGFNVYGNVEASGIEKPDNYMNKDGQLNENNTHSVFFKDYFNKLLNNKIDQNCYSKISNNINNDYLKDQFEKDEKDEEEIFEGNDDAPELDEQRADEPEELPRGGLFDDLQEESSPPSSIPHKRSSGSSPPPAPPPPPWAPLVLSPLPEPGPALGTGPVKPGAALGKPPPAPPLPPADYGSTKIKPITEVNNSPSSDSKRPIVPAKKQGGNFMEELTKKQQGITDEGREILFENLEKNSQKTASTRQRAKNPHLDQLETALGRLREHTAPDSELYEDNSDDSDDSDDEGSDDEGTTDESEWNAPVTGEAALDGGGKIHNNLDQNVGVMGGNRSHIFTEEEQCYDLRIEATPAGFWSEFKEKFDTDIQNFEDTNKYNIDAQNVENIEEEPIRNIILTRLREKDDFIFGSELQKKILDVQSGGGDGDNRDGYDDTDDKYIDYIKKSGGYLKYHKNLFLNLIRSYEVSLILLLNEGLNDSEDPEDEKLSDIQMLIKENKRKLYFTFNQYIEILEKLINLYNNIFEKNNSIWKKINNNNDNYKKLYTKIDELYLHDSFDNENLKNKLKEIEMINFTIEDNSIKETKFKINGWWDYISLYNTDNKISKIKTNFPYGHGIMIKITEMIHKILIFVNKIKNDLKNFDENDDYDKMFNYYNKLSKEITTDHDINIIKHDKNKSKGYENYPNESVDDAKYKLDIQKLNDMFSTNKFSSNRNEFKGDNNQMEFKVQSGGGKKLKTKKKLKKQKTKKITKKLKRNTESKRQKNKTRRKKNKTKKQKIKKIKKTKQKRLKDKKRK